MVDIVLATNRRSPFLGETLESVYQQVGVNWHLTVVDDGCPDPDFLRDLLALRPSVTLIRQEPGGVSRARNTGFRSGSAELVSFLDDDDLWEPDRLRSLVDAMGDDGGVVGAYSGAVYIDSRGELLGTGWPGTPGTGLEILSGAILLPRLSTLVVRRKTVERAGGFDPSYRVAEDNDFTFRVLQQGELVGVDRRLVRYRRHPDNTSVHGALEGRVNNRRLLVHQLTAARAEGRTDHALALQENLRRAQTEWALEGLVALKSGIIGPRWGEVARELRWLAGLHKENVFRSATFLLRRKLRPSR